MRIIDGWALASNFLVFVQVVALITHEVLNFIALVDNQRPRESLGRSAQLQLNLRWWFGIATNLWIVKVFFFNRSSYLSNSWYHIRRCAAVSALSTYIEYILQRPRHTAV